MVHARALLLGLSSVLLAACTETLQTTPASQIEVGEPIAEPDAIVAPAGSEFTVRLNEPLSTVTAAPNQRFTAEVTTPLLASSGQVIVRPGSTLTGHVVSVQSGPAQILVALDAIDTVRGPAPIRAKVTSADARRYLGAQPSYTMGPAAPVVQAFPPAESPRDVGIYPPIVVGEALLTPGAAVHLMLTAPLIAK